MSKKKILVVDDDTEFREAICDVLKKKYQVLEAPQGKVAIEIMNLTTIDLVLSDIQMEYMTGLELLEWSKKNKPTPFIIMTGFSMLLETKTAYELGANGFLAKPFKNAELLTVVESIIPDKSSDPGKAEEKPEFCMVSIDEFIARPKIEFDVYMKLSDVKTIKLAHKGDELPKDRISNYKDKGVRFLYILKQDYSELVDFKFNRLKINPQEAQMMADKKVNILKFTTDILNEKVLALGIEKQSFMDAQAFLLMLIELLSESKQHFTLLDGIYSHSENNYAHSVAVSLFSIMVAKKIRPDSTAEQFKIAMASLFHDIGKREIDSKILSKPRETLNKEEQKAFENHVLQGEEILAQIEGLSEEIVQIVSEHHEDLEGEGFPLKKKGVELHPLSPLLQAVNSFIDLSYSPEGRTDGLMDASMAATFIEKTYTKRVSSEILVALKSVLTKPA